MDLYEYQNFIAMVKGVNGTLDIINTEITNMRIQIPKNYIAYTEELVKRTPGSLFQHKNNPSVFFSIENGGIQDPSHPFKELVMAFLEREVTMYASLNKYGGWGEVSFDKKGNYETAKYLKLYTGPKHGELILATLAMDMFIRHTISGVVCKISSFQTVAFSEELTPNLYDKAEEMFENKIVFKNDAMKIPAEFHRNFETGWLIAAYSTALAELGKE